MTEEIAVFCGLDVGKSEHHTTALDRSGERIFHKQALSTVLMSMPGVGIKTAATILLSIGDASTFTSAGHLAA